jgi:hypothetical protein
MGAHLQQALHAILEQHATELPHLKAVWFDPYQECANETHQVGHISFRVRLLTQGNQDKPQLCPPVHYQEAGDDFSQCRLNSLVAWDHVSWPGNDFYGGARATDDGVKAAATDSMRVITGIAGAYDPHRHAYVPPKPFSTWGQVVADKHIPLLASDRLRILSATDQAALKNGIHNLPIETPESGSAEVGGTTFRHIAERDNTGLFRGNPKTIPDNGSTGMSAKED